MDVNFAVDAGELNRIKDAKHRRKIVKMVKNFTLFSDKSHPQSKFVYKLYVLALFTF
jgi:hypothetical protein